MKVKELIELLSTQDKEMQVLIYEDNGYDYARDDVLVHLDRDNLFVGSHEFGDGTQAEVFIIGRH